jgi:hypothetical protein
MMRHTILILLCLTSSLLADVTLDVKVGYGERFRPGRWTPVFLTVQSDQPLSIDADLRVASSSSSVINIQQRIGAGPVQQTYVIYAPVSMLNDPLRVTLTHSETGQRVANWPSDDPQGVNMRFGFSGEQIGFFALTAGRAPAMQNLIFNRGTGTSVVAHAPTRDLPRTPVGYESIDLLFLNNPDFSTLSVEQQSAVVSWVRAGGCLILWPGIESIPADAPLQTILPASPGDIIPLKISAAQLDDSGLPGRFAGMSRRTLIAHPQMQPTLDVTVLGDASAIVGRCGLGRVMMMPVDASTLQFESTAQFQTFWQHLLSNLLHAPANADAVNDFASQNEPVTAAHAVLDMIGNIPSTGSFGFGYIAITLLGLMLVVGPVDYFVLKKLGHQPWTWATTIGWIGLFTVGAVYAGSLMRSGELHLRTARLIDQAPDGVVAENEVALVYAPRSSFYTLSTDTASDTPAWWQPVPGENMYSQNSFALPVNINQNTHGTSVEPMWINVWSWRFLQSRKYVSRPVIIESVLTTTSGSQINLRLTNLSNQTLRHIVLGRGSETFSVKQTLLPGATVNINPTQLTPTNSENQTFTPVADYETIFGLSPLANDIFKDTTEPLRLEWVVYAELTDIASTASTVPAASTTLTDASAIAEHRTFVRACFFKTP